MSLWPPKSRDPELAAVAASRKVGRHEVQFHWVARLKAMTKAVARPQKALEEAGHPLLGVARDLAPKNRAAYFRERAEEVRAIAANMSDYGARKTMMEAAQVWVVMAEREERRRSDRRVYGLRTDHN